MSFESSRKTTAGTQRHNAVFASLRCSCSSIHFPPRTILSERPPGSSSIFLAAGSGSAMATERQGTIANIYRCDPPNTVTISTGAALNAFTRGVSLDSKTGFCYMPSGYSDNRR